MPTCSKKIVVVNKEALPKDQTVMYCILVCDIYPHKSEMHRTRLPVGENKIEYPYDVSTATSDLITAKCIINSTLSTPTAKYLVADIKKSI